MSPDNLLSRLAENLSASFSGLTPFETTIAILCIVVAILSLARLWLIGVREPMAERLSAVRRMGKAARSRETPLDMKATAKQPWYDRLGAYLSATVVVGPTDRTRLARALVDAGFRGGKYRLATLVAIKLGLLTVTAFAAWSALTFYGLFVHLPVMRFFVVLAAVLVGWRIPDTVLSWLAARRRRRIERGLPDALDLLVITAEAGLSLEQGIEFVASEMASAMPDVGEEFAITSAELRVLGDRRQALQNLADRVNLQSIRSIIATLNQTMRYGTPLAQSLRLLAAEMRNARVVLLEERAARMPVLLTFPLAVFILPSLMMVIAGPAFIRIADAFLSVAGTLH